MLGDTAEHCLWCHRMVTPCIVVVLTKEMGLGCPETDYYGICSSGAGLMYVGELLATLGYPVQRKVFTDATSARDNRGTRRRFWSAACADKSACVMKQKVKEGTLQVSTVPGKDNLVEIGTKYQKGYDVQRFSEWITFKDEKTTEEDVEETRRPEAKCDCTIRNGNGTT